MFDFTRDGYYVVTPEDKDPATVKFVEADEMPDLKVLYKEIGCQLGQPVYLASGGFEWSEDPYGHWKPNGAQATAWVDEEGKGDRKPFNPLATGLCAHTSALDKSDFIVGTMVIVCGKANVSDYGVEDDEEGG